MQRHPSLVSLSHEHHHGLVWVRTLNRLEGQSEDTGHLTQVAREFLHAWEEDINPHFHREEEVLLPLFAQTEQKLASPIIEMLNQHVTIRSEVMLLREAIDVPRLLKIARLIQEHIRLEEQEVFPYIEKNSPPELLQKIGEMLGE